jgi:hypothetical protein
VGLLGGESLIYTHQTTNDERLSSGTSKEIEAMPANSISDFLSTYESPAKNIICPACGNPMGLLVTGSYKMVLTTPARNELNNII